MDSPARTVAAELLAEPVSGNSPGDAEGRGGGGERDQVASGREISAEAHRDRSRRDFKAYRNHDRDRSTAPDNPAACRRNLK